MVVLPSALDKWHGQLTKTWTLLRAANVVAVAFSISLSHCLPFPFALFVFLSVFGFSFLPVIRLFTLSSTQ